jgi:energy-coupling factor transporter ATP-binding protein EcfA2
MRRTRRHQTVKRIKKIEINHFKGLYGEHEIDLTNSGKNLMLYGENGSGKSSVAKAIKLFFQSSAQDINIVDYENIFVPAAQNNTGYIKLTIGDKGNTRSNQPYVLDNTNNRQTEPFISKTNKIKGFLDYKSLLKTHYLDTEKVNVFELLVEDLLTDFVNSRTTNTIETDWSKLKRDIHDRRTTEYAALKADVGLLEQFNEGLTEWLEDIEIKANEIIDYFKYNLKIKLHLNNVTIARDKGFANKTIELKVDFFDKPDLPEHHRFLNEARLTAISIAIYLGAVLSNIQDGYRLLILDDVFIGLDTSNRLPFLKILDEKFSDYQIFMTTYDKSWYELVKSENKPNWEFAELYIKEEHQNGYEIPILHSKTDFIDRAEHYLNNVGDLKASASYIRSEFERLVKNFCHDKKISVKFNKNQSKISSEDFWSVTKDQTKRDDSRYISEALRNNIETQRTLVMNPFVHYDLNKPTFRAELVTTIDLVKQLKTALS